MFRNLILIAFLCLLFSFLVKLKPVSYTLTLGVGAYGAYGGNRYNAHYALYQRTFMAKALWDWRKHSLDMRKI